MLKFLVFDERLKIQAQTRLPLSIFQHSQPIKKQREVESIFIFSVHLSISIIILRNLEPRHVVTRLRLSLERLQVLLFGFRHKLFLVVFIFIELTSRFAIAV